jgi:hypothetical protein
LQRRVTLGVSFEQRGQPLEGLARRDESLPGAHHQVDGRQGAAHEHVGCDHRAWREFTPDHQ